MSSSSRRTYDTDSITLRTVFAKNPGNSNVPALRVLTADGAGGTYWAVPSTLGVYPSFNRIITSEGTYTADLSYNTFRLLAGEGIGMVNGPTGSNQTSLFAKAFSQFDISGENSVYAFLNNQLDASVKFAGENGIQLRADPATNTFFIGAAGNAQTTISTGIYGFNQFKITPTTSTITSSLQGWGGDFLTATSPSTLVRFSGYNDIQLSTNVTTNTVFFTISTFTSKDYLNMSNSAFSAYPSSLSTVSSLYLQRSVFESFSTSALQWSSVQSSINALAISTGGQVSRLDGRINACATIVQLNNNISQVNSNIVSTVRGLGSAGYISTAGGGGGDVTQANLVSTVLGLGSAGYISTGGGSGDVTKANLISTVEGLGTYAYVSSFNALRMSTGFITVSSINLVDTQNNDVNFLTVSGATLLLNGAFVSGGSGGGGGGGVSQIVAGSGISLSPTGGTGVVTVTNTGPTSANLISTVEGLGSSRYVSTASLLNLVSTQNLLSLVSTPNLLSLVSSPNFLSLVSSPNLLNLISTNNIRNIVSTNNLRNLVSSMNLLDIVSTPNLLDIVSTPNLLDLISTPNLLDLISTPNILDFVSTPNLLDLISSPNLISSFAGLQNVAVTRIVAGTNINVSGTGVGEVTVNVVGAGLTSSELTSTVKGLGNSGYISSFNTFTISTGNVKVSTLNILDTYTSLENYLTVSSATLLLNGQFITGASGGGGSSGVSQILAGTGISLNPPSGVGNVLIENTGVLQGNLVSTVAGLGTNNYISTLSLVSTTLGLQRSGFLSTQTLVSTVEGLGTYGYVSSLHLRSTVAGLGLAGYVSTTGLTSTVRGLGQTYFSSISSFFSTFSTSISRSFNSSNVTISTLFASNATMSNLTVSTITFDTGDGFIDFPDIRATSVSTFLINTSTINVGYLVSTQVLEVSSIVGPAFLTFSNVQSSLRGLVSTPNLLSLVSSPNLLSLVSSPNLLSLVSTPNLLSHVSTPNLLSLISSPNLLSHISTPNLLSLVSSPNLFSLVSTSFLDTQLVSTVRGL